METITIASRAKINLGLDLLGRRDDGYHLVRMVMHQVDLRDELEISWEEGSARSIRIESDLPGLPLGEDNLAWKAAERIMDRCGREGGVRIRIRKRIPVAAGLAGGSGNGAAALAGLNALWGCPLDLPALMELGGTLGADVPFCVMGIAAAEGKARLAGHPMAVSCALAEGIGTDLTPLPSLRGYVVLAKPDIGVSTAEVYRGMDELTITSRPRIDDLLRAAREGDLDAAFPAMGNVLEEYTLRAYDVVARTRDAMRAAAGPGVVLMSGSGPTVFYLTGDAEAAERVRAAMEPVVGTVVLTRLTA